MTERKFTPPTEFPAEYVTGRGKKVTLLARGKGLYPLIGQGDGPAGCEVYTYTEDGYFIDGQETHLDLIEKPKTHRVIFYVNVFKDGDYQVYSSRAFADQYLDAMPERVACKRIEFEVMEGEFDE